MRLSHFTLHPMAKLGLGAAAAGLLAAGGIVGASAATGTAAGSPVAAKASAPKPDAKDCKKDDASDRCKVARNLHRSLFEAEARTLGMTPKDLRKALAGGKTLHELAGAKSMNEDQFKDALLKNLRPLLDADVDHKLLTKAQADGFFDHLSKHRGVPGWDRKHHGHRAP